MNNIGKTKELHKQINSLNMLIDDLASTESNESVAPSIDIKRIEQLARQSSYKLHFINSLDEDIIIKYCALLNCVIWFDYNIRSKSMN